MMHACYVLACLLLLTGFIRSFPAVQACKGNMSGLEGDAPVTPPPKRRRTELVWTPPPVEEPSPEVDSARPLRLLLRRLWIALEIARRYASDSDSDTETTQVLGDRTRL